MSSVLEGGEKNDGEGGGAPIRGCSTCDTVAMVAVVAVVAMEAVGDLC